MKGIYRVNGAKSRVEKLCQAFENGKHLVELSELYPHDISNVLKLYLRQVGCFLHLNTSPENRMLSPLFRAWCAKHLVKLVRCCTFHILRSSVCFWALQ